MKKISYSRHAKRRMKWRRISEKEVKTVLSKPDKQEGTKYGRKNAQRAIEERLIKVTFKEINDKILIISAVDKRD